MTRPQTAARQIAQETCSKFPKTPSLTLAKKLFAEYPEVYKDIEAARSIIRLIRGKVGSFNKKNTADKSLFEEKPRPLNPFALPKSYAKKRRHVEVKGTKFLILCDLHFPYQDNEAIECAINEGLKQGCDSIILNGDALDCHMISDFVKDPRKRKFKDELYSIRQFLASLRHTFPNANIYYKEGNDPAETGQVFGTPHQLASLYGGKGDSPVDIPTGYDETVEKGPGRPKKYQSKIGTDASAFGRDPLGKNDMKSATDQGENDKLKVQYKGGPLAYEGAMGEYIKNKQMLDQFGRSTKMYNQPNLLSEDNIKTDLD